MDSIEINDDEINVEDIMRQIRENIKKRKESGAYSKEMEELINKPMSASVTCIDQDDMQHNLNYINRNWDLQVEYNISSHRPLLGRFLVWGRQFMHGEVKRYVDIVIGKQIEFNAHVVQVLNNWSKDFDSKFKEHAATVDRSIDAKVDEAMVAVNRDINIKVNDARIAVNRNIDTKVAEAKAAFDWEIDNKVNETVTGFYKNIDSKVSEAAARANKPLSDQMNANVNYFLFEEKFRGGIEEIKQRQSIFLEYFKNCKDVLDIGCGRGEFLSLLKENGVGARGIDINEDMVSYCQKNGIDVQKVDALSYLESLDTNSLDGIFTGQFVEHLQPVELVNLVKLCYAKMKSESYFIAETINPLCLSVFAASFYMDLSHVKPVHPETIKFLLESVGFKEIKLKFFSPFPEAASLSKLTINNGMSFEEKTRLEAMNQNIDKLNSLLYGYQDYAVIAKK